ncbi:phage tail protein [Arsenophonus sp. PmNCSU2021_1]|uniref:phage tail protein n=1 Tax=Arsenophonus sp. PmNCSU2021_1 TaxID=3118989 RepID=UPI002FEF643D
MHRIDTPTAQKDKFGQGKNGFTNGDPTTGTPSTKLNSDICDALEEEVCTVVERSGIRLNKSQHDQLYQAIIKLAGTAFGGKIKQILGNSTTDVVSQKTVTEEVNKKLDKASVLQTTGNATDKVISQKACDDNYAKKNSWERFTAGQIDIRSNGNYASLSLIKGDGNKLLLENTLGDAYFVYRDAKDNNKAVVTIPSNKTGTLALTADVDAINNYPVGAPIPWPHETAPAGYLICNGQTFTKADYPELALAYPSGKLPNLYGEFIRGLDLEGKVDPGRKILTHQGDAIRNITGRIGYARQGWGAPPVWADGVFFIDSNHNARVAGGENDDWGSVASFNASRVVPTANENRPRNVAFLYIVRAA